MFLKCDLVVPDPMGVRTPEEIDGVCLHRQLSKLSWEVA